MRIGYAPTSPDLNGPADRRRFPFYAAQRGLEFEIADLRETYDVVVITPRADLTLWSRYRPVDSKIIFDMVDSYLDIPRADPKALLRGPAKFLAGEARRPFFSYRTAIERMLERADAATCATPEQAAATSPLCPNSHAILDFQSEMVRRVKSDYRAGSPFHLVWEGLGENARWFSEIAGALAEAKRRRPLVLHLITALEYREFMQRFLRRETQRVVGRQFQDIRLYQWSEEMVSVIATACDVAVIPLPLDRAFTRAKPENKLISFWRMGMPTVTSSTPAYVRTMREAGQALCCSSEQEWLDALVGMMNDEGLRAHSGQEGKAFTEQHHSDEQLSEAWDRVFESL